MYRVNINIDKTRILFANKIRILKEVNNMRWIKLAKSIIESILFVFCGFLIRLSFSQQLNYINNILLFIGAIIIIAPISQSTILRI